MNLQIPLIQFDESKAKLILVDVAALPSNEELISPAPARDFVQDIFIRGILQPIHLQKIGKGKFYVIAGRRRIKAMRALAKIEPDNAKWKQIQALVVDVPDETAILAASAENNRRSGNVLTDLQALDYLLAKNPSMSIPDLSKYTGMNQGTVKSRLKLKKLQPELLQALIDGKMTASTAEKAAVLPQDFQSKLLIQLAKEGRLSLEDVSESQRTRVQQTVDSQLTLPDIQMDPMSVDAAPLVIQDATIVESILPGIFRYGWAVFSIPDRVCLTPAQDDQALAQADLESYQGQVESPDTLTLVQICSR